MREIKGYEHPFDIDQRDIITKVIEGRLVPKDLSTFNSFDGDVDNAYVYVDNNGTPAKISLIDISEGMFPIVEEEPKNASINQLVLVKVNESEYKLEKFGEDLAWHDVNIMSNADIINFIIGNSYLKSTNVQDALDELSNHLENDYYAKSLIKEIALTGKAESIEISEIDGIQSGTNLQKVLEEIWQKEIAGFICLKNADKIQLSFNEGLDKNVLRADVVANSLGQEDFTEDVNKLINTIIPNQDRITALENRADNSDDTKANKEDVQKEVDRLDSDVAAETERAINVENQISGDLADEISRAKTSEANNTQCILDEITRALDAEDTLTKRVETEENTRETSDKSLSDRIDSEISTRKANDDTIATNLSNEVTRAKSAEETESNTRLEGDNKLQEQIDAINSRTDVADVVGTKEELDSYDITKITINDIVKVLKDESKDNATTYYRLVEKEDTKEFKYVGEQGPFYTISESDERFVNRNVTINGKPLTSNITLSHEDIVDNPVIGDATINIQKNGETVGTFSLNDTNDKDISLNIPTKVSEIENDKNYINKTVVELDNFYTKNTIDTDKAIILGILEAKADRSNTYTKSEVDKFVLDNGTYVDQEVAKEETRAELAEANLDTKKQDNIILASDSDLYFKNEAKTELEVSKYKAGNGVSVVKEDNDYKINVDVEAIDISTNTKLQEELNNRYTKAATDELIKAEETRAKSAETTLQTNIDTVDGRVDTIDNAFSNVRTKVNNLNSKVTSLETDVLNAQTSISNNTKAISTEKTRAEGAEKTLSDSLSSTKEELLTAISTEKTRAEGSESTLTTSISEETTTREEADTNLQNQIDKIKDQTDIVDVVETYANLESYDFSKVTLNDIIVVLSDEKHNNTTTYYRYVRETPNGLAVDSTTGLAVDELFEYLGTQGLLGNVDDVKVNNVSVLKDRIANIDLTSYSKYSETGNKINLSIDSETYKLTATLSDKDGNLLSTSDVIDLPIESLVVDVTYNEDTKTLTIKLQNGTTIDIPLESIISGLASTTYVDNKASTLQTSINLVSSNLTSEITTRESADTTLQTNINKKVDKVTGKSLILDSEITRLSKISDGANKVEKSSTNGNILIDKVETTVYTLRKSTATISTSDWTSDTTGAQKASITLDGITEKSMPEIDIVVNPTDLANLNSIYQEWSKVYSAITSANTITLYTTSSIERDLTISIKGY